LKATTLAEIRSLLAPGGKFVLVLRLHGKRSKAPNPLSRNGDEVSAAERAALTLCYALGHSNEEAAAILEMPLGTVKSHILRGREKLRALLEGGS
jgi:DNA-directed RNA polymerase specialized sigma24 family protein